MIKIVNIVIALILGILSSLLLALVVTYVWNSIITDTFNVSEISFLESWVIYFIISLFPITVTILK